VDEVTPVVKLESVVVSYVDGDKAIRALDGISLAVEPGDFVSVTGPSGSGKTTLLNIMAGLEQAREGRVTVAGHEISAMSYAAASRVRRDNIAYIFQFFNLLPSLSAIENVEVPLLAGISTRRAVRQRAEEALEMVGLGGQGAVAVEKLSGGEMQRVAIARSIATRAILILADEPTGNLDSVRSEEILHLLKQIARDEDRAVVLVTHDLRAAACADRLITLTDGRIIDDARRPAPATITPIEAHPA
jgi:putative ABC transport system ATP-binding protein